MPDTPRYRVTISEQLGVWVWTIRPLPQPPDSHGWPAIITDGAETEQQAKDAAQRFIDTREDRRARLMSLKPEYSYDV